MGSDGNQTALPSHDSALQITRMLDQASDFIFIVNSEFVIVSANKTFQEMLGKSLDSILGRRCYEIVHGTPEPPAACPHLKAMAGNDSVAQQVFGSRLGIHVHVSVMPIFAQADRLLASIHVGRAIYEHQIQETGNSARPGGQTREIQASLTPRQKSVLELLTEGRSSKEIATELHLSPRTVEFHKQQLMRRLNVKSLAGLIKFAFLEDLVK